MIVLREVGSNGDRELAAAFYRAGFEVWDLSMEDLRAGPGLKTLEAVRGIAFAGGFSRADVLGSAKGEFPVISSFLFVLFNAFSSLFFVLFIVSFTAVLYYKMGHIFAKPSNIFHFESFHLLVVFDIALLSHITVASMCHDASIRK